MSFMTKCLNGIQAGRGVGGINPGVNPDGSRDAECQSHGPPGDDRVIPVVEVTNRRDDPDDHSH